MYSSLVCPSRGPALDVCDLRLLGPLRVLTTGLRSASQMVVDVRADAHCTNTVMHFTSIHLLVPISWTVTRDCPALRHLPRR